MKAGLTAFKPELTYFLNDLDRYFDRKARKPIIIKVTYFV